MSPDDCKPGMRVWYEPSPVGGVRFLGTIVEPPRNLGSSWVVRITMATSAYGQWRLHGGDGVPRSEVPAASLDCVYTASEGGGGLTHDQLVVACKNIGFDLTCGACACVFMTGHGGVYPHDEACQTK